VVDKIKATQLDPDTDYGYRKMYTLLMIAGYFINHKKVYRLMEQAGLLKERHKKMDKTFVKYRVVIPEGPLEVLEMDIKYVWVRETICIYSNGHRYFYPVCFALAGGFYNEISTG